MIAHGDNKRMIGRHGDGMILPEVETDHHGMVIETDKMVVVDHGVIGIVLIDHGVIGIVLINHGEREIGDETVKTGVVLHGERGIGDETVKMGVVLHGEIEIGDETVKMPHGERGIGDEIDPMVVVVHGEVDRDPERIGTLNTEEVRIGIEETEVNLIDTDHLRTQTVTVVMGIVTKETQVVTVVMVIVTVVMEIVAVMVIVTKVTQVVTVAIEITMIVSVMSASLIDTAVLIDTGMIKEEGNGDVHLIDEGLIDPLVETRVGHVVVVDHGGQKSHPQGVD